MVAKGEKRIGELSESPKMPAPNAPPTPTSKAPPTPKNATSKGAAMAKAGGSTVGMASGGPTTPSGKAGSLSFDMDVVDPIPVLEKLQIIRNENNDSFMNTIDICAESFETMKDLQVELQTKLILTNTPPEVLLFLARRVASNSCRTLVLVVAVVVEFLVIILLVIKIY